MPTTYRDNTRTRTNPKNHVAARCTADRLSTRKADPAAVPHTWSMHVGHIKLFIIGPADQQWFSCSKPCYTSVPSTTRERAIAHRAIEILNRDHNGDVTIQRPRIDAILAIAAQEIKAATA